MLAFFQSWGFTGVAVGVIALVQLAAVLRLGRELRWIRLLTDYLGYDLVRSHEASQSRPSATLEVDEIRDQANAVLEATDPVWAQKQVRGWQMRIHRLEPALGFWIDLLRQLGLLGTVLGLGISITIGNDVNRLLAPLGLAVWTTAFGLACSIWLGAQFSGRIAAWSDACEKNLEAWDHRRLASRGRAT